MLALQVDGVALRNVTLPNKTSFTWVALPDGGAIGLDVAAKVSL